MHAVCSNSQSVDIENCNLDQQKTPTDLPALFILNLERTDVMHNKINSKTSVTKNKMKREKD